MSETLKDKAIGGLYWVAIERFSIQALQLIVNIWLARLLLPEDYGIVGLLAVFIAVATILVDCGFGSSLIQNKNRNNVDYSTAFIFNASVGILIYGILFLSADAIASFYDIPLLSDIIKVYALTLVFNSFQVVHISKLTVEFKFKTQAIIALTSQILASVAAITMAYCDWGVWSLVFYQVFAYFLKMLLFWIFSGWIPSLIFSIQSFLKMFRYGSKIVVSAIIDAIYSNIHSIVIGKKFSVGQVGYYTRGNQFPTMLSTGFLQVLMKVCFPVMADIQDDIQKLSNAYRKFLTLPMFVLFPALFLLAVMAEPIVLLLLGEKWLPSVPFLQIMCFGCMFDPLTHINLNVLFVKDRTDLVLKLEVIKKTIAFAIVFISLQFGIYWLCAGQAFYCLIAYVINCHYTKRYVNLGLWDQIVMLFPLFMRALIVAVPSYIILQYIDGLIWQLFIIPIVYLALYLLWSYCVKDVCLDEYVTIIKSKLSKNK